MRIYSDRGLFVNGIAIDAKSRSQGEKAFISHGHADHVSLKSSTEYFCSEATADLVRSRFKRDAKLFPLKFGQRVQLNGASASLFNSGHILGSVQVLVEDEKRVAVTSDFKLQDSIIQKGAVPIKADILVLESTFGLPSYSFPDRQQVYAEIGSFVREKSKKGFVVLAGYSLGKAQELTKAVNEFAGIAPLVHESVYENNLVYERHGVKLGPYLKLDHNLNESSVLIMPPSLVDRHLLQVLPLSLHRPVFSAMATGWSFRGGFNRLFPLSDHADFRQLMDYVKQSEPKLVLTTHGFENEMASYVRRRLGIPARPLAQHGQKTITEYA